MGRPLLGLGGRPVVHHGPPPGGPRQLQTAAHASGSMGNLNSRHSSSSSAPARILLPGPTTSAFSIPYNDYYSALGTAVSACFQLPLSNARTEADMALKFVAKVRTARPFVLPREDLPMPPPADSPVSARDDTELQSLFQGVDRAPSQEGFNARLQQAARKEAEQQAAAARTQLASAQATASEADAALQAAIASSEQARARAVQLKTAAEAATRDAMDDAAHAAAAEATDQAQRAARKAVEADSAVQQASTAAAAAHQAVTTAGGALAAAEEQLQRCLNDPKVGAAFPLNSTMPRSLYMPVLDTQTACLTCTPTLCSQLSRTLFNPTPQSAPPGPPATCRGPRTAAETTRRTRQAASARALALSSRVGKMLRTAFLSN